MSLKRLISRKTLESVLRLNHRALSTFYQPHHRSPNTDAFFLSSLASWPSTHSYAFLKFKTPDYMKTSFSFKRFFHATQEVVSSDTEDMSEDDKTINEFLSRFVWIMRKKLVEFYADADKNTVDGMLLIIVAKVLSEMGKVDLEQILGSAAVTASQNFSDDLWNTVSEVSNMVSEDMEKAQKKEKLKEFLHNEEVKEMCRFAGEVGIRGEMLREFRFKWAREKMEESEFYQNLEQLYKEETEAQAKEEGQHKATGEGIDGDNNIMSENDKPNFITLPKRDGKIKYKIYGLDLSSPKWGEVADKIHEAEKVISPEEPKPMTGRSKLATEKILSLQEVDDPSAALAEWVELLRPSRIDWVALLDKVKQKNINVYYKIAEFVLGEESFQANVRDYSKLIDAHVKENRTEDAERILKKMNDNGILPDILTLTTMVHMYCKTGNLDKAKHAFESLKAQGLQPDMKLYNCMIMASVNAGQPKLGDSLMREMDARDIKPTEEIYMALLRSYARLGDSVSAQRIDMTMQFAGLQPTLESCTLLVEAFGQAGDPDQARHNFDYIMKLGHKPDDKCTAIMLAAYEKKNHLDKALTFLLELEKDGFVPGVATYAVLLDWFAKMQLIDEAEQILDKIAMLGEAPPFKVHVSLCAMYANTGAEKKALQALEVLEAKKELLGADDFERIIQALVSGGFQQDALRIQGLMEAQGFRASENLKIASMAPGQKGRRIR